MTDFDHRISDVEWDDIDTLTQHGWEGERYVTYIQGGLCDVVLGFGDTPEASLISANREIQYAGVVGGIKDGTCLVTTRVNTDLGQIVA